jgi:DMSO/TMAO reductase YedYZ molybdopterin-dependent catalytic subunit
VPGWYGCAWIKWVTDVRLVDGEAPVTSQMAEFAARTHQQGEPLRARAYEPPAIDVAATPIRVEQWRVQGRTEYRVIGIVWGGDATPGELAIRFGARDAWRRVSVCRSALAPAAWSLWAYTWRPDAPGTYDIALSCPDTRVPTRRLDLFYYVRRVRIDDV